MRAPKPALTFLVLLPLTVLLAQGGAPPRPVSPTGIITDPGFAGALANSVQGTLNMRPGRYSSSPYIGGFAPWGGFYQGGGYFAPLLQTPPVMEQVNAPAVVLQQPALLAPVPDAPVVSVYSYPAHTQTDDTPAPPPSPNVAGQNAAALQALSQSMDAANALANGRSSAVSGRSANDGLVLIALKDQNIVTAIAYWTDRSELKYVTPARQQKQVPLSQVDVKFSERLNNERHVQFHLESLPRWEPPPQY